MKILAIRGKNLASLAGDFEVDFQTEPLAGAGLFAICGPTGAGKSTLLDALCLALYDDTPRLAGADGRGIELPDVGKETTLPNDRRNILRRGCAEAHAEVDFVGSDGIACRARWSVRRARNRSEGKLQPAEMSLLRLSDLQPVCGHLKSEVQKAIVERIGLSFGQFTRAVLLAQNEFFTFLKAGEDERAALLQTLTGTDRFELISRRAFERNKAEQEKLRAFRDRLADQQPLDAEARAAAEAEREGARSAVTGLEAQAEMLAVRLRWHEEGERLRRREAEARSLLQEATARRTAAAPRQDALARVEAVQPARPLMAEAARLEQERSALATRQSEASVALVAATRACAAAAQGEEQARRALAAAQADQDRLAPLLARARQLDTEIAALAPALAKATSAEAEARAAAAQSRRELATAASARGSAAAALEGARGWLAARQELAPLAEGWMRWDALFAAALDEHGRGRTAAAELERLTAQARRDDEAIEAAARRQASSAAALAEREGEHRAAAEALAGIDAEALARRRAELEARRQAVHAAEQAWRELAHSRRQTADLEEVAKTLRQGRAPLLQALADARARRPAADAAAEQAERAWKLVFEATRVDVESLRRRLVPDAPCPVCGSSAHPYASHHPGLDDALTRLADERERCRGAATGLAVEEQTLAARLASLDEQSAAVEGRRARLALELDEALKAWEERASALALDAARTGPATDATPDESWLAASAVDLQAARSRADEDEARHRHAGARQRAAQSELDAARKADTEARETLVRLRAEAARTEAATSANREAAAAGKARLEALLDQLDAARPPVPGQGGDWRRAWAADPAGYREACGDAAEAWLEKKRASTTLEQDVARLHSEEHNLAQLLAQAEARHQQAVRDLAEQDEALTARRDARKAVFAAQSLVRGNVEHVLEAISADAIEHALGAARAEAQDALAARQQALRAADAERARAEAATAQLASLCATLEQARARAAVALADWLAAYNAGEAGAGLDEAALAGLLAHDVSWIAAERHALRQLDTAVAGAQGGHDQLLAQREAHARAQPPGDGPEEACVEAIQRALTELTGTLRTERDRLGHAELALRSDDEVRSRAAALVATIEAQEAQARIWWQMNELIGAADGKKFRNYAQQLTLDVLLGYANAHLRDLARRYRLERVPGTLALMVIDQDMGDEQRSVHSLSGGESFLVSLALALGLASLSSHRMRVESLFIDEGFGSLDANTLRVAMDALDRLQALGRKVGVISHVEEMTERIGTRIEVRRLAGGRSEVVVDARA